MNEWKLRDGHLKVTNNDPGPNEFINELSLS